MMNRAGSMLLSVCFLFAATALSPPPASATPPGMSVNPNGFPSGPHYNLNIHGKKDSFTCPAQAYYYRVESCGCGQHAVGDLVEECNELDDCSLTDTPIYGNSIFVPENGEGIEIYMQSGKVGGKGNKAAALPQDELWAVDPCAGFDGDGAVIQLPPGEYDVYARALAKPTDEPTMTITSGLTVVQDEYGNNLVYLGLVTEDGFATGSETFTRKKGKSKAVSITGLFEWTGTVCYFDAMDVPGTEEFIQNYCCADGNADGVYEYCCTDSNGDGVYDASECSGDLTQFDPYACTNIETFCNSYTEEWIFNIADFVEYLWDTDNNGLKLLQVRFYPR
jgi:hypothetical protein